jgi:glycosyltransferase involved in cell wall biosynthesis
VHVGVVTPAFNVAPYIGDAIRSVLSQIHQDWTMTIVDDGSTDETASVVASFGDPRLRLIRQCNQGVSAARNRGVMATTDAEAVLLLDADDWLSPDALSNLTAALRLNAGAIAAIGPYMRVSGGVLSEASRPNGRVGQPASGDLLERLLVRNLFANGGHLLIRRNFAAAAGPFHTGLCYGEDWEYWIRLACLGLFVAVHARSPLLFVRERHGGAYLGMASRPGSFVPCMDAIFNAPALKDRFSAAEIARLRRRADAENDWIVGRELIRHGRPVEGRGFLLRSVRAAPSPWRLTLLAAGSLPIMRIGPFRPYAVPDAD